MKIAVRVDASQTIGSGHVMRCLALADVLRSKGATMHFICRAHEKNLIAFIRGKQYACTALELPGDGMENMAPETEQEKLPDHASWLGVSWQRDAEETGEVLKEEPFDWLIADHYALDQRWESAMRPFTGRIMAIDDLADREHDCDVLLDSVCGRRPEEYHRLAPSGCRFLLGSEFVMLRPEFAEWRPAALQRREKTNAIRRILVTLGGMDPDNLTGVVLDQLADAGLPTDSEVEVVLGSGFSHTGEVKEQAVNMPVRTNVSVAVDNMAEKMTNADLAVNAGGVSVWECCCLGLPAITVVTAANQQANAEALKREGINEIIPAESVASDFQPAFSRAMHDREWHEQAVSRGSRLADGQGAARVAAILAGEGGGAITSKQEKR